MSIADRIREIFSRHEEEREAPVERERAPFVPDPRETQTRHTVQDSRYNPPNNPKPEREPREIQRQQEPSKYHPSRSEAKHVSRNKAQASEYEPSNEPKEQSWRDMRSERKEKKEAFRKLEREADEFYDKVKADKKRKRTEEKVEAKGKHEDYLVNKATKEKFEAMHRQNVARVRKGTALDKIKARDMERHAKRAEFVAKHPYLEKARKSGINAKENIKDYAYVGVSEAGKAFGNATGVDYIYGQQQARITQSKKPKTKTGKTTTMREFTPTQSNMVAPTASASTLMGQSSGLNQMIQAGGQQQNAQRDWLGDLKYGLGGEKQTDYFGNQSRQTVNTTRRNGNGHKQTAQSTKRNGNGLGLGMGIGSGQDYFKAPVIQSRQPAKSKGNGLGLGMGIGSTKDYISGSKRTVSTTKRNNTGLSFGLSNKDYLGSGKKNGGILKTTKSKKMRYY